MTRVWTNRVFHLLYPAGICGKFSFFDRNLAIGRVPWQVYQHKWQDANCVLKGEKFHAWFALAEGGETIQLPIWVNTSLEVLVSQWLATREAWDRRIAARALEGKVLAPKMKQRHVTWNDLQTNFGLFWRHFRFHLLSSAFTIRWGIQKIEKYARLSRKYSYLYVHIGYNKYIYAIIYISKCKRKKISLFSWFPAWLPNLRIPSWLTQNALWLWTWTIIESLHLQGFLPRLRGNGMSFWQSAWPLKQNNWPYALGRVPSTSLWWGSCLGLRHSCLFIYIYVILLYIIYVLGLFSTLKGSISLSKYIIR